MKINTTKKYEIVDEKGNISTKSMKDILSGSYKTILYFYPKDNTPGCSLEAKDFTAYKSEFDSRGMDIVGVSKDSLESHIKFIGNQGLNIPLISDSSLELHKELGVYGEKNNYGKIVMGVIRSTFIIDKEGNILKEWRNVKATGHVEKILREL